MQCRCWPFPTPPVAVTRLLGCSNRKTPHLLPHLPGPALPGCWAPSSHPTHDRWALIMLKPRPRKVTPCLPKGPVPSVTSSALAEPGQSWVKVSLSPIYRSLLFPIQPSTAQKPHSQSTLPPASQPPSLPASLPSDLPLFLPPASRPPSLPASRPPGLPASGAGGIWLV